jgi:uncharacterized membrane protein YjjP (DUF1212 family)
VTKTITDVDIAERQAFVLRVGELLHRYGTPSHRLEQVMSRISDSLGIQATYLYTPTALLVSFDGPGLERTKVLRVVAGEADLGKLFDFDDALEKLEDGTASLGQTLERVERVAAAPPRYGIVVTGLACGVASACATVFFGGGASEVGVAALLGICLFLLGRWLRRFPETGNLLEALAGFIAAMGSLCVAAFVTPIDDRLATLGAVIVLLPGLAFTVAMTELASRHLSSGVARLAGAGVVFLTLAVGVALAWRLGANLRPAMPLALPLPAASFWPALIAAPVAFAIQLRARRRQWPIICAVAWSGFVTAKWGLWQLGPEFGAFAGALVIGGLSNLYARLRDRPAMVPQVPSVLILVPGSIGYQSVTAFLDRDVLAGIEFAFSMTMIAVSIAGGLLAANAIVPPRRVL